MSHGVVVLVEFRLQELWADPVQAADAVLYAQVFLLVVRGNGAEHAAIQTRHDVLLHIIHQRIQQLLWTSCHMIRKNSNTEYGFIRTSYIIQDGWQFWNEMKVVVIVELKQT